MGFYYNNKVEVFRVFDRNRHIVVRWFDDVIQKWYNQRFEFEQLREALDFAEKKMNELAM